MSDAFAPKLEKPASDARQSEPDAPKGLAILPPPGNPPRDSRPVTNLGKIFGQFAELQQQIAVQVGELENSVHTQKQDLAAAVAQLPELRERINWLIASFYEQSKKDESVRDRLGRHDAAIDNLADTVRCLQKQHCRWESAFDEVIAALVRAKAAISEIQ